MTALTQITLSADNLLFLGAGFVIGLLSALGLAWLGMRMFSGRFKTLSDQSLYENSRQFMDLAQSHFSGYVREAHQDFKAKQEAFSQAVDPVHRMLDRYEQRLSTMEKDRGQAFGAISQYLSDMAKNPAPAFQRDR